MTRLRRLFARIGALLFNRRLDDDFSEELQSHIDLLADEHIARGVTPAEARRLAAARVGNVTSLRLQHRDIRSLPWMQDLWQDLRFATRLIGKDRWFSAAAVAAIALGIGANTLGFTIVNAAFIRGFGFDGADRLYAVSWRHTQGRRNPASVADLADWRSQSRTFAALAGYSGGAINISDDTGVPEQTQGAWVTANHFSVLRQSTLIGRDFTPDDERRGAELVTIIGYDLWKHRYALDPQVLGRLLRVNGQNATIIGVMPERMKFPDNSEMWVPFVPTDAQLARRVRPLSVIGRLADDATRESATAELAGIVQRIIADHPDETRDVAGVRIETLLERFLGGAARPMFITVMGAVMFVLLIACANVASLLLSRAIYRSREIAVRYSMGATRTRVVRQLLVESVALSSMGGLLGLGLAWFAVAAFDAAVQMSQPPYWLSFTIDYRVVAYVAGMGVATGILFGLAPALHVSRGSPHDALRDGGRGAVGGRRAGRFANGLVVAELALTVVLLCGAGLMLRSFVALYASDAGFPVEGLARMRLQLPPSNYPTAESRQAFFDRLAPRLAAIPGLDGVALTTAVPPLDGVERVVELDDARPVDVDDKGRWASTVMVTPGYFDVLGVPMVRGRDFAAAAGAAGPRTVIVSQVMAERFFPGQDPVGRRLRFTPDRNNADAPAEDWRVIVGVSGRLLQGSANEAFHSAVVYVPFREDTPRTSSLIVRSALPPAVLMADVRRAVQAIDADQPVFAIQALAEVIAEERLIYRIFATLFALLAAIALVLSSVGLYAVMAYAVTQRTQEIGVRMAVGAQRWQVSWMFLRRALAQLALGLAIGLPAALALAQVARFQLVEIEPSDPITMIGITLVLAAVSIAASLLPVRTAARVDPVTALRSE